jgi:hypothetical protein
MLGVLLVIASTANAQHMDEAVALLGFGPEVEIAWSAQAPGAAKTPAAKPTLELQSGDEIAELRVLQVEQGLWLMGQVRRKAQRAPSQAAGASYWRLQIAAMPAVLWPPIAWQRADQPLREAAACDADWLETSLRDDCRAWVRQQLAYRAQLLALLRRDYRIDANGLRQSSGGPLSGLAKAQGLAELGAALPEPFAQQYAAKFESFQLLLDWSKFPARSSLSLDRVYLRASRCNDRNHCTALATSGGKPQTSSSSTVTLVLPRPQQEQLTRCAFALPESYGNAPSYVVSSGAALRVFNFQNPGGGYLDRPDSTRVSPELSWLDYQEFEFAAEQWLCQPGMVWQHDGRTVPGTELNLSNVDFTRSGPDAWPTGADRVEQLIEAHIYGEPTFVSAPSESLSLEVKPLGKGRWLLLEALHFKPPNSGEGMNGACDTAQFSIWFADANRVHLRRALLLSDYAPDLCAGHGLESVVLSNDLSLITARFLSTGNLLGERDSLQLSDEQLASIGTVEITERYCLEPDIDTYLLCSRQLRIVE